MPVCDALAAPSKPAELDRDAAVQVSREYLIATDDDEHEQLVDDG